METRLHQKGVQNVSTVGLCVVRYLSACVAGERDKGTGNLCVRAERVMHEGKNT